METKLISHRIEAEEKIKNALIIGLEECGQKAEAYGKLHIEDRPRRVDTGRLRGSITYDVRGDELIMYLGTNVEYAGYVHEGTSRMEPNRFLENAIKKHAAEYKDTLEESINAITE